jgi:outer membrane immunogenic protein
MKSILLSGVAVAALVASPAFAADMPVKAPKAPPPPVLYNWTGCYIGAHIGGAWAHKEWSDPFLAPGFNPFNTHDASGVIAGGQIGCDYQFTATSWVIGAEVQGSWGNLKGDSVDPLATNETDHSKVTSLGTITGRIGYAWDRVLLYAKGGGAWAHDKFHIDDSLFGGATHFDGGGHTRWGWTVGAGVEYAFLQNWSVKLEYNYMDFGDRSVTFHDVLHAGITPFPYDIDQRVHLVKVGINWRFFGGPLPVVANY